MSSLDTLAAATAFVPAAAVRLRPLLEETKPLVWPGASSWEPVEIHAHVRAFQQRDREEPRWALCIAENREALQELPEYRDLIVALRRDPVTQPQLDAKVGTALASREISADEYAPRPLLRAARRSSGLDFDERVVKEECVEFQRELYASEIDLVALAPLIDLRADRLPIVLDEDLCVDAMADADVVRALTVGVLRPDPIWSTLVVNPPRAAIRSTYRLPKIVGRDPTSAEAEAAHEAQRHATEALQQVFEVLRLFKDAPLDSPGVMHFSND